MWVRRPYKTGCRRSTYVWEGGPPATVFHFARPHVVREVARTGRFNTWKGIGRGMTFPFVAPGTSFTTHPGVLGAALLGPRMHLPTWGLIEIRADAIPELEPVVYSNCPRAYHLKWMPKVVPAFMRFEAEFFTPRKRFDIPREAIVGVTEKIPTQEPRLVSVRKEIDHYYWGFGAGAKEIDRLLGAKPEFNGQYK